MSSPSSAPPPAREWDLVLVRQTSGGAPGDNQVRLTQSNRGTDLITFTSAEAASAFSRELQMAVMDLHLAGRTVWTQTAREAIATHLRMPLPTTSNIDQHAVEQHEQQQRQAAQPQPFTCPDGRELRLASIGSVRQGNDVDGNQVRVQLDDHTEETFTFDSSAAREAFFKQLTRAMNEYHRSRLPQHRMWRPSNPETIVDVITVPATATTFHKLVRNDECSK